MKYRLKNKFAELFDNPSNVWTEEGIKTLPLFLQEMFEPIPDNNECFTEGEIIDALHGGYDFWIEDEIGEFINYLKSKKK